jgi:cytidylate kinase
MTERSSSIHLPEALIRAAEHWQQGRSRAVDNPRVRPSIAVSREEGASGTQLARAVGARLGWPVYDHELLEKIAGDMKLRVSLLESVDEKYVSWFEEGMTSFTQMRMVDENSFVKHLVTTVVSLGKHGECVIVGRGSPHILPAASTLRVRVIANLPERVDRLVRERRMTADEAKRRIELVEKERRRFLKAYFDVDATDPHLYDVIVNLSFYSMDEAADVVVDACRRMQARLAVKAAPVAGH